MAMRQALTALLGSPALVDTRTPIPVPAAAVMGSVVRSDTATLALAESALTTGRPLSSSAFPSALRPAGPGRGVMIALAIFGTLIAAVAVVLVVSGMSHHSLTTSPRGAAATGMATATGTAAGVTPMVPAPTTATAPPRTTSPPLSTVPPEPSAVASPSVSVTPSSRPAVRPAPVAPRGPAPAGNPFDQRF
jgi:hypothetical protein